MARVIVSVGDEICIQDKGREVIYTVANSGDQIFNAREALMTDLRQCPNCKVWTSNTDHTCVEYDPNHPCPDCGAPSVFTTIAAPGVGSGWTCQNNHYDGTVRELTAEEVI